MRTNESITQAARAVNIDRTHLSKLENGQDRPSPSLLRLLISHYSLLASEAQQVWSLAGFPLNPGFVLSQKGRGVGPMNSENIQNVKSKEVMVNVPIDKPILYCDSVFVSSNNYGLILDFAQAGFGTSQNQQNVVFRVGMSKEHAQALINTLTAHVTGNKQQPLETTKLKN